MYAIKLSYMRKVVHFFEGFISAWMRVRILQFKKLPFYASKMFCYLCCCCYHFLMFLIGFCEKSFDEPTFILSLSSSFCLFLLLGREELQHSLFNLFCLTSETHLNNFWKYQLLCACVHAETSPLFLLNAFWRIENEPNILHDDEAYQPKKQKISNANIN